MSETTKILTWRDLWKLIRDPKSVARERAARETGIILAFSLLPLTLGATVAYAHDVVNTPDDYWGWLHYVNAAFLGGQLFLVFLALAGSNFARLWDPQAPRISFSGFANTTNFLGAALTLGLIGVDPSMSKFSFFPFNLLSLFFYALAALHYFCLAVPSYMPKPDPVGKARKRADGLAAALDGKAP